MYVVAGATGRVGSATARTLLESGAEVRVLVRRPGDAGAWEARGADVRILALEDQGALSEALAGCAGFFTLLPFDLGVDDLDAYADRLIGSIAGAVAEQRVPHVVMLSSGGADLREGTGPITGLHRLEQALLATGTTLTALRSGHFQEKVADVIDLARAHGVYPVFASSADIPLPMVATADIGIVAARALSSPPASSEAVDVVGPAFSEREVASMLGDRLGRPLQVTAIEEDAWSDALIEGGLLPHVALSLAELYRADEHGMLAPRGDRRMHVHTRIEHTIDRLLAS